MEGYAPVAYALVGPSGALAAGKLCGFVSEVVGQECRPRHLRGGACTCRSPSYFVSVLASVRREWRDEESGPSGGSGAVGTSYHGGVRRI